jgi:hypothetical protein
MPGCQHFTGLNLVPMKVCRLQYGLLLAPVGGGLAVATGYCLLLLLLLGETVLFLSLATAVALLLLPSRW